MCLSQTRATEYAVSLALPSLTVASHAKTRDAKSQSGRTSRSWWNWRRKLYRYGMHFERKEEITSEKNSATSSSSFSSSVFVRYMKSFSAALATFLSYLQLEHSENPGKSWIQWFHYRQWELSFFGWKKVGSLNIKIFEIILRNDKWLLVSSNPGYRLPLKLQRDLEAFQQVSLLAVSNIALPIMLRFPMISPSSHQEIHVIKSKQWWITLASTSKTC